ncbi:hypothetical protein LTR10_009295 [Elasticomyces elasticus]|nr:hypothetical protein LTR10_009295 [Elasticomyces elasticus]KAK4971606.1 hypothetical protein LTR42_007334 [Elasticomyces elasticus]
MSTFAGNMTLPSRSPLRIDTRTSSSSSVKSSLSRNSSQARTSSKSTKNSASSRRSSTSKRTPIKVVGRWFKDAFKGKPATVANDADSRRTHEQHEQDVTRASPGRLLIPPFRGSLLEYGKNAG